MREIVQQAARLLSAREIVQRGARLLPAREIVQRASRLMPAREITAGEPPAVRAPRRLTLWQ